MNRAQDISERLRHWLLILLSPLILGIIASFVVALGTVQPVSSLMPWIVFGLAVVWIVLYLAAYGKIFQHLLEIISAHRRCSRFKQPRVLILDGRLDERGPASVPLYSTNRRPDEWHHALTSHDLDWAVDTGPVSRLVEGSFDIVLNPFGEAYPEENLTLHTTLKHLTDWVHTGVST